MQEKLQRRGPGPPNTTFDEIESRQVPPPDETRSHPLSMYGVEMHVVWEANGGRLWSNERRAPSLSRHLDAIDCQPLSSESATCKRHARPDSGYVFQAKAVKPLGVVPSLFGSGLRNKHTCTSTTHAHTPHRLHVLSTP